MERKRMHNKGVEETNGEKYCAEKSAKKKTRITK